MWNKAEPEYLDFLEKPPAGSGEIKDFKDTNWWTDIRYWLISKLAGKSTVIINARFSFVPRHEDKNIVLRATDIKHGLLSKDNTYFCDDTHMMLISKGRR